MTNDQTHPPEITNIEQTSATPKLPPQIATLDAPLQALALRAISARRRRGEALLEAARWLHEAHTHAQTGEWDVFLETTGTSRDTAEQLLNLHIQTMRNPRFAELIRSNWLHPSAAMLLAHPATPPDVIDAVLATTKPLTVAAVAQQIRAARGVEPPPAPSSLMATGEELALSLPKGARKLRPTTPPPTPAPRYPTTYRTMPRTTSTYPLRHGRRN